MTGPRHSWDVPGFGANRRQDPTSHCRRLRPIQGASWVSASLAAVIEAKAGSSRDAPALHRLAPHSGNHTGGDAR